MNGSFSLASLLKNRTAIFVGLGAFLLTASLVVASRRSHDAAVHAAVAPVNQSPALIAGPGRVEPYSEDIKIGSELSGRLKSVNVEEGDTIHRGQVLAELENADYRAQVESARANVAARQAVLRKVINGARRQERDEAWSSVDEKKAVMLNAQSELHRRQELFSAGVVSREELDRYAREADVTKAKYEAAVQQHSLVDDHARRKTGPSPKPIWIWRKPNSKKRKPGTRSHLSVHPSTESCCASIIGAARASQTPPLCRIRS